MVWLQGETEAEVEVEKKAAPKLALNFLSNIYTIFERVLIWKNLYYLDNLMTGPNQALVENGY